MPSDIIDKVIVAVFCLIATSFATFIWAKFSAKFKKFLKELEAVKENNVSISADRLTQSCNHFLELGYIPVLECQNIEKLFKSYENLGGNGTIKSMVNSVMALPKSKPNDKTG